MKLEDKASFIEGCNDILEEIYDTVNSDKTIALSGLNRNTTALMIVDLINGFVREGALASPRVEEIIHNIKSLAINFEGEKLAFADCHGDNSPEFASFPCHCLKGSTESALVDEIKDIPEIKIIHKNSTNGFHEAKFKDWLKTHRSIHTFIITGDCTDICVMQFALSIKTWFNKENIVSRVIVPLNAVETFSLGSHDGDLTNVMALYFMLSAGVEIVKQII